MVKVDISCMCVYAHMHLSIHVHVLQTKGRSITFEVHIKIIITDPCLNSTIVVVQMTFICSPTVHSSTRVSGTSRRTGGSV